MSELSGVDLARHALIAAREVVRKNGATQTRKPKRRTTAAVRRDGREPLGPGSAIDMMMTERGMVAPAADGSALADFDAILTAAVPELAGRAQATAFDADTGRLDVVPDTPAVATKLRWSAPQLLAAANERVPTANVRALHVLAPAPVKTSPTTTAAATTAPQPTMLDFPVERRTPPERYRRAIEPHRQVVRPSLTDSGHRRPPRCVGPGQNALLGKQGLRPPSRSRLRCGPSREQRGRGRLASTRLVPTTKFSNGGSNFEVTRSDRMRTDTGIPAPVSRSGRHR